MTHSQRHRSPAKLAAWLQKVMARAIAHLPALSSMGGQVHQHASWHAAGLESHLHTLHESLTALEWGARWPGPEEAEARGHLGSRAEQLRASAERAVSGADTFLQRSEVAAGRLGPALLEFVQAFRVLEKVVERCGEWMLELEEGLARSFDAEVSERLSELRSRLALLQAVDRSARNVHALADSLAVTRPKLAEAVQRKVKPSCASLCSRLVLLLQGPLAPDSAVHGVTGARSEAQIWVTQALSLALRMQASQDRLVREAGALRHRCSLLPRAGQDGDRLLPRKGLATAG
ncbi:hypothetical protein HHL11_04830 [Ramlibacter sp. G-1-2-2]|uniref:Uncharacterized protein n=2 Tax=Ramlibacter agri TaxID=2728837 RepID=A0A848GWT9_9BURK|nr:hypothetical protein [Ramlibacter agri]